MNNDDRDIYSDTGYFTRGRSGFRPGPQPSAMNAVIAILALLGIGLTFALCVILR